LNPEKTESRAGQPASILVVDDTPANLQVLAGMLKDRGYKVRPVPSGKLALLAAQHDPPDLILLDINMPEMNGYEVCEHLKADDRLKGIPVIFISALTEPLDKVKAFATGGVDYLTKPFQVEELHARVETHLKLRRLQIELEETNARLAKADRRKNEFLALLAHELRNPLAPIRNALQIMRLTASRERQRPEDEAVQSACAMMERQVGQIVRLVDDLLDVSRISRGKIELRRGRIELASAVHHAVEAIRPQCKSMDHALTVTLPPKPLFLNADPTRLAQVVGNLLNNACKFTDKGGQIWLTVEVASRECERPEAVIRVRDNGIGIAADQLPRIFEMFTQLDTSLERSVSGLGIGLTLVRNLVEMHDGTVEVHSAGVGQGSEFVVRLPLWKDEGGRMKDEPGQDSLHPSSFRSHPSKRILVVDDNRDSATSLAMVLKLTGHETHTAYDGLEAVEAAAVFRPDVVLLDIGLPKLNGYDACRKIREQPWGKGMVLIALTGWGKDEDRRKSQEAGFDSHLVKPVDHAALTKLLAELRPTPA